MDFVGAALLGIVVSMLILFTTTANWMYLLVTCIALILFIVQIRRAKEPFVDPSLFANPLYRSGLIIGFLIFGTVMSMMFVIPMMLRDMYGLNTENIGLIMFPGAISAVIFGKVAGNMTVKRGSHFVVYLGLTLIALSLPAAIFIDRALGLVHRGCLDSDVYRVFLYADSINGKRDTNIACSSNRRRYGFL